MGRAWLVYAGVGPSVKASAQTSISQEKMAHPVLRESDFTIHRPRSRAHTIFQSLRRTLTEERSSSDLGEPPHDGLMQGFCTVSGVYSGKTRLLRKYGGEAMEWAPGVEVGKGLQHVLEVLHCHLRAHVQDHIHSAGIHTRVRVSTDPSHADTHTWTHNNARQRACRLPHSHSYYRYTYTCARMKHLDTHMHVDELVDGGMHCRHRVHRPHQLLVLVPLEPPVASC